MLVIKFDNNDASAAGFNDDVLSVRTVGVQSISLHRSL